MAKTKQKQSSKRLNLSISCWNIDGLVTKDHNKLCDDTFLKKICDYDIIGLVETHCIESLKSPLSTHRINHNHRTQDPRSKRTFGGISLLVNKSISKGIVILPFENSSFMWFKLNK